MRRTGWCHWYRGTGTFGSAGGAGAVASWIGFDGLLAGYRQHHHAGRHHLSLHRAAARPAALAKPAA